MKKYIVLLLFLILGVVGLIQEPIDDTFDLLAGATNETYNITIDDYAGPTEDDDDDEEDDD